MTIIELRDLVIEEGIKSVRKHEKRGFRRRGCLRGFELCRNLLTPEEFSTILTERQSKERSLVSRRVPPNVYWEYRCATAQIEHLWERLKVIYGIYPQSARAIIQYAKIVGVKEAN